MDYLKKTEDILRTYSVFSEIRADCGKVLFKYRTKDFAIDVPSDPETDFPILYVIGDQDYSLPHIMPYEGKDGKRYVCLRQDGTYINFLFSFEEKIHDLCNRLISLMDLSDEEKEEEFHKEFLFYWNEASESADGLEIYIGEKDDEFGTLNAYVHKWGNNVLGKRLVKNGVRLNDCERTLENGITWQHNPDIWAVYIPLMAAEGILPPLKNHPWTKDKLLRLLEDDHEKYLSDQVYRGLCKAKFKGSVGRIVLGLPIAGRYECCAVALNGGMRQKSSITERIHNCLGISTIRSYRSDYKYLSQVIGNDSELSHKNVLIVGAGSLGSYICKEIVKTGIRELTVYDGDKLARENTFRWNGTLRNSGYSFFGSYKTDLLNADLERIHPEVIVDSHHEYLTVDILQNISDKFDAIIFTVGSSDYQFLANKTLRECGYKGWAVYVWLEPGGSYSHILSINHSFPGCYQCLFTDATGHPTDNLYNRERSAAAFEMIRTDVCGGTRASYGNAVLLRTTASLLGQMKCIFSGKQNENCLIDITPEEIINQGDSFKNVQCKCCGIRNSSSSDEVSASGQEHS